MSAHMRHLRELMRERILPDMRYLKRRISSRARTECRLSRAVRPASERFRMVVLRGLMSSRRAVERWLTDWPFRGRVVVTSNVHLPA